jgi:hypothetical protein
MSRTKLISKFQSVSEPSPRRRVDDFDMIYDGTAPEEIDRIVFKHHPYLGAWK